MSNTNSNCSSGRALFRLASGRNYNLIPSHIREHPDDVYWQDIYGSTALHSLCIAQSMDDDTLLEAVDAILAQAPDLAGKPNVGSWTPLHMACDRRVLWRNSVSTERLVMKLLDAFPEAVSIPLSNNYYAKTPFHIACENNASITVLRRMLRLDPSLAATHSTKYEQYILSTTPLQELWKSISRSSQREVPEDISKMRLVLKAAYAGSVDVEDSNFHVLCAACSMRCPRDYISLLIRAHPELIRQPDKNGLLPLHYAVQSADVESPYATDFILGRLLQEYPEAAGVPFDVDEGILPLHFLIADRGCTFLRGGALTLIKALPETLRIPDPRSGLVPALATAETAALNRMHLSTTYEILRAGPDIIQHHHN